MSIEFDKVLHRNIRAEEGTAGGKTYYVILPNQEDERALCFRRTKEDLSKRCTNPAGYGTWHLGTGACKFHGGATSENLSGNIKSGRTATITRQRLASSIQSYLELDRNDLLDMTYELAATKAIYDELLSIFPEPPTLEDFDFRDYVGNAEGLKEALKIFAAKIDEYGSYFLKMQQMIGSLGNLAEKMSRIETRNSLTAAQVLYLRATVADLLIKYIADPNDRERAAKELANRMGGEIRTEIEMKPSEYGRQLDG